MTKRLDEKHHGAIKSTQGFEYEIRFSIKKLIEILLPTNSGVKVIKVTRQKKEYVDDVVEERDNKTKTFYQCKHFKKWRKSTKSDKDENKLWEDFINQHKGDSFSELVLVTQNKDPGFEDLANLARGSKDLDEFKQELESNSYYKAAQEKFKYLNDLINQKDSEVLIFSFLKKFRVASYDNYYTKDDAIKELKRFFDDTEAENIYNAFHSKLNSDWLSKTITREILIDELKRLKINIDKIEIKEESIDISKVPKLTKAHLLADENAKFAQKLAYLLKLINEDGSLTKDEIGKSLNIISSDTSLSWHFLKNLNKPEWFPKIKDNVIKSIVELEEDSAVKFQLLSYFEKCADKYSDEIVPLIAHLEKNTQNYNILSNLVKTLGKLKPKQKKNIKLLWEIFSKLTEHQHPWVRREIPQALLPFVEYNIDKVLEILEKVFFYNPPPQDVTQGGPTLALTFQGRDNENWVFEEAIKALSQLLNNPKYAEKALELAIKVEIEAIKADEKDHEIVQGITLDYSYIWLGDKSFDKLEYNHDRKERVALEIEKALDKLSKSDKKLVTRLINKLLGKKFEVFYLTVVKTLIRQITDFQSEAKSLVFNTKLWQVYNIRNYYLQTLVNKYFETTKGKEVAKFAGEVSSYEEKDKKRTLHTKQDLLISIPESQKTDKVKDELEKIAKELKLKGKPKITKPFVMISWSGARPDITVEELETKSDDELIQIMVDSSTGKRAGAWDLRGVFAGLIDKKPEKLKRLLLKMKDKKLEPDFAGEMVSAYIKKNSKDIAGVTDLIPELSPNDSWARIEIARYLNEICRKKEIQRYSQRSLKKIKGALFTLSKDKNPETDETIKSNNPRPDDAITRGINSVRGIATEALVIFSYYFPKDKEVSKRLEELADDKTNAVKATLIYNLRYLTSKNYQLCEKIINKFKSRRDPEIDFALIHLFAQLDCDKFIGKKDFIKALFNDNNEQIREDLGELIGYRYINCCDVEDLIEEIMKGYKGDRHTLRSLAFVFESQLASLIGNDKASKVAGYLKRLLGSQNEYEVAERASFVFERDEIKPEHFEFMDENGLMDELISNQRNIPVQMHLVNYLSKCVDADVSIDRSLELLHKQVTTVEFLLSDHLIAKKVSEIVDKLANKSLSKESKKYLIEVFDAGLERGWDEFYSIYTKSKIINETLTFNH